MSNNFPNTEEFARIESVAITLLAWSRKRITWRDVMAEATAAGLSLRGRQFLCRLPEGLTAAQCVNYARSAVVFNRDDNELPPPAMPIDWFPGIMRRMRDVDCGE